MKASRLILAGPYICSLFCTALLLAAGINIVHQLHAADRELGKAVKVLKKRPPTILVTEGKPRKPRIFDPLPEVARR